MFFLFRGLRKSFSKAVGLAILVGLGYFGYSLIQVATYGQSRITTPTDAIVVMGAAEYNGKPSLVFEARLKTAEMLYRQGVAPKVVVVGGSITGDHFSEAQVGQDVLEQDNIPAASTVSEPYGVDTYQSLSQAAPDLHRRGIRSVTVVSDGFHLFRSVSIIRSLGFRAYGYADIGSPIRGKLDLEYYLREAVAVAGAKIIGYKEESLLRHG